APSRFEPIGPDLWQNTQGDRISLIRNEEGQIVRLADGTGAHTHDRLSGLADPIWLWVSLGGAVFLSVTTLLGLLWRHGLGGGSLSGTIAAGMSLAGAVSVLGLVAAGLAAGLAAARLGSEYLFNQPQPTLEVFLVAADIVAVVAAAVLLSLVLVWRAPGWSLWRRLHHSLFAVVFAVFSGLMLNWGLAFGGPI
ncbi:MAG: hypothetical protein R6U99_06990, partial [Nioella sp.]